MCVVKISFGEISPKLFKKLAFILCFVKKIYE